MGNPITILLVDDHDVVKRGLAVFLQYSDELRLVGEASDGQEALELCASLQPDVVLMDLIMPGMDGLTAISHIRERFPSIRVIALTSSQDGSLVPAAIRAGAVGYLLKNVSVENMAVAIRAAARGERFLSPEATQSLIEAATQIPAPHFELTQRELDVLILMVEGLNNNQISERLTVSHSTVKFHVSSIISKLGASNRTEAAAIAIQHGLVHLP